MVQRMLKSLRIAAIATPLVLTSSTVGIYLAVASKKVEKNIGVSHVHQENGSTNHEDIYENFKIFPKLDQHDFYKDIKIVDNDVPTKNAIGINGMKVVIDNEMKAKIINYILRNMETTEGSISYGFKEVDSHTVKFYFMWENNGNKPHYRTYKFSLSDSTL